MTRNWCFANWTKLNICMWTGMFGQACPNSQSNYIILGGAISDKEIDGLRWFYTGTTLKGTLTDM